jgi:hypothetical protein
MNGIEIRSKSSRPAQEVRVNHGDGRSEKSTVANVNAAKSTRVTSTPTAGVTEVVRRMSVERSIYEMVTADADLHEIGLTSLDMVDLVLSRSANSISRFPRCKSRRQISDRSPRSTHYEADARPLIGRQQFSASLGRHQHAADSQDFHRVAACRSRRSGSLAVPLDPSAKRLLDMLAVVGGMADKVLLEWRDFARGRANHRGIRRVLGSVGGRAARRQATQIYLA